VTRCWSAAPPKDTLATLFYLRGHDPETMHIDRLGRPQPLIHGSAVIDKVLE